MVYRSRSIAKWNQYSLRGTRIALGSRKAVRRCGSQSRSRSQRIQRDIVEVIYERTEREQNAVPVQKRSEEVAALNVSAIGR
jgi:hypothetical protein